MKQLFFALILISATTWAHGQTDTIPEKLRYSQGFFSTKYELGDVDKTPQEITLHLEKTSPAAYYDWKRGRSLETQSAIWGLVGSLGTLTAILSDSNGAQIAGYGVGLIGYSVSLGTLFGAQAKTEKAINTYNKEYGYR